MALLPRTFLRTVAVGTTAAASIAAIAAVAAVPAGAASAPDAYVRIEGARATLVGQTLVRTQSGDRVKSNPCSETSAAGALDDATHGKWSGSYNTKFGDYLVSSIDGETPTGNNFWTLFVNGRASSTGACETPLHPGDHVLWFDCQADANFNCTNNPLAVTVPAVVQRGHRITAHVTQIDGAGHSTPIAGAAHRRRHHRREWSRAPHPAQRRHDHAPGAAFRGDAVGSGVCLRLRPQAFGMWQRRARTGGSCGRDQRTRDVHPRARSA